MDEAAHAKVKLSEEADRDEVQEAGSSSVSYHDVARWSCGIPHSASGSSFISGGHRSEDLCGVGWMNVCFICWRLSHRV